MNSTPQRDEENEHSVTLIVQSQDEHGCAVLFEPYGAEYALTGEDRLRVVVGGGPGGEVGVVHRPQSIMLWPGGGWDYLSATNRLGEQVNGLF